MVHQDFQKALEQISNNEVMNSEEIKSQFNLSKEDMMAMEFSPSLETKTPRAVGLCCCCCFQSDN